MRRYYLGLAAKYSEDGAILGHVFSHGREKDCKKLEEFLAKKYDGEAILTKNGRSALALALKAYFKKGDEIIVNGFTCFAVYEAVKAARCKPIFVDINPRDLNFSPKSLKAAAKKAKGIIVQNSLGNSADVELIEKLAGKHGLVIIEDLAHSAGMKYPDGREAGTIGAATALSFGKDKAIDTVSGGAVVLREKAQNKIAKPSARAKASDTLRARFYPLFGALSRALTPIHLGGALMRGLIKIHFVEKSADNKLDLNRKISRFEAKLALEQLKHLRKKAEWPLRYFYLVDNRAEVLEKLKRAGYYFGGFWYERPISPERYYKKVHFPEKDCPNSVKIAGQIINFPTYYSDRDLILAKKIIEPYLITQKETKND